jgi:hypothetical protein
MIDCFLESVEGITRELRSLLLRTISKEIKVNSAPGQTNFDGEVLTLGQNIIGCIQYENSNKIKIDVVWKLSDKSSQLTGKPLAVANKLLKLLIWHLHKMVLVKNYKRVTIRGKVT